jgi:transposase
MPLPPAPPLRVRPRHLRRLEELIARGTTEQRVARRARVVLDAADGLSNADIAQRIGISRQSVIAIRQRFEASGIASVLEDAPRPGRPRSISDKKVAKIVEATLETIPKNRTHWSSREMAKREGVSFSTIQRIWHAHELQPHRVQNFKFSKDPYFVEKLRDIVGLYMKPPTNAIVLSVDEKSSVQALERTAPILALRAGIPARQTHDYRRNGTTTLFAALNTLNGKVIQKCLPRHRHTEFIEFLEHIDRNVPSKLEVHIIMDNYATHKKAEVQAWFIAHPRYHVHFTPTSSSWLNAVERFFSEITAKRIRRGTFSSVPKLIKAITAYVEDHNANAQPFVWTKSAAKILKKIRKCHAIYASGH